MNARGRLPWLLLPVLLAACVAHPRGEDEERDRADAALAELDETPGAVLPERPTREDWLRAAFHGSASLRARYAEWRAALERIPIEASPPKAALQFSYLFDADHASAWDRTTLGITNDPMENIPWPSKLGMRGRLALERARAAGLRFEAEKYRIQAEVSRLYADLAFHAFELRAGQERVALLGLAAAEKGAGVGAGRAAGADLFDAGTALELARNDLESLHAQMPPLFAEMNALVGRDPQAPIELPDALPEPRPLPLGDAEMIAMAAQRSPELGALSREVAGREEALELAKAEWLPDFGLGFSVMGSLTKSVSGMVVLPTRVEAIRAGVREAEWLVRAAEAAREQYSRDLAAGFVLDLYVLRNAERQARFFETTIVPRAELLASTARGSSSTGTGSLGGYLEARLALLEARLAVAQLWTEREKTLAAIESFAKVDVEALHPVRMASD